MSNKKHKLRLRKQVIICIPISIIMAFLIFGIVIKGNNKLSNTVEKQNTNASTKLITNKINNIKDIKYFNELSNRLEIRQKENTVIYYAQKFKINVAKTLELAKLYTNNFQDEWYLTNHVIGPEKVRNKIESFPTEEAGIIYFVRDIYRYPEKYGSTLDEIRINETFDTEKIIIDNQVYLSNGLTYEQYLGKVCDAFGLDKTIVLAVSYHETGFLKSSLFTYNNVGGQRGYIGWMKYPTLEAGIVGHVTGIMSIVDNYDIDLSSPDAIAQLSSIYVNGHPGDPDAHWTEKVTYIKGMIEEQDLFEI